MNTSIFKNKKLSGLLNDAKNIIKQRQQEDEKIEESIQREIASDYILKIATEIRKEQGAVQLVSNAGGSVSFILDDFSVLVPSQDIKRGVKKLEVQLTGILSSDSIPSVAENKPARVRGGRVKRLSEEDSKNLVERIKKYREEAKVSQQDLASAVGITQPEMSAYERGVILIRESIRDSFEEKISP